MAIEHKKIRIKASATLPNVIEIHVPTQEFQALVKKATKGTGSKKTIEPAFVIQILCRHLLSQQRGVKVTNGSVDNW